MKNCRLIIATAAVVAAVALQPAPVDLQAENLQLKKRIAELESWLVAMNLDPNNPPPPAKAEPGARLLMIEEVREATWDAAQQSHESKLIKAVTSAETKLEEAREKKEPIATIRSLTLELRAAERELVAWNTAVTDAYFILGWDGHQDIIVYLPKERIEFIRTIRIGQYATFHGEITDSALGQPTDSAWSLYTARRLVITQAPAPPMFRPAGRTPVWEKGGEYVRKYAPQPRVPADPPR